MRKDNASVTIIEFSSYECPFCKKFFNETLPQLKEEYIATGKVKFVYRDSIFRSTKSGGVGIGEEMYQEIASAIGLNND